MTRKKLATTAVAVALSAFFLYLAFRNINMRDLAASFAAVKWIWIIPVAALTWLSFWWRAWRWQKLLEPKQRCAVWHLFGPTMVGFAFNNIFPARIGELARPLALKKQENVPFTTGLSTVVLERMFDVLALLILFILVVLFIDFPEGMSLRYGEIEITRDLMNTIARNSLILAVVGFAGAIAMLSSRLRALAVTILRKMPLVPHRLTDKAAHLIENFALGFDSLRSPWLVLQIVFHTAAIWLVTAASIWAMGFGFPGMTMTFFHAMVFLVVTAILVALPSAPGYWGVYEIGGQAALVMIGLASNDSTGLSIALGFTLLFHFIQWAVTTAIGLFYAAKIHVSVKEVSAQADHPLDNDNNAAR